MKFTEFTRDMLRRRRERKRLFDEGYEEVGEGGGKLWELHRGARVGHIITDVKIAPDGKSLFIKTAGLSFAEHLERRWNKGAAA